MKKTKKTIMIGEEFVENSSMGQGYYDRFKTLGECYDNWSNAKQRVYDYYLDLLQKNSNLERYGIRSYNCNVIVLHAITELNGQRLYLTITPSHNWFVEI